MSAEDHEITIPQSPGSFGFLLVLMHVALKKKQLVGVVALGLLVLSLILVMLLPDRYTATVTIMPPQQSSSQGAAMMAQLSSLGSIAGLGGGALGIKNPNDLQVALLKSASVENAMVERFHLRQLYHRGYLSSARKRWERVTHIDNGLKDGLIRLAVTDTDPVRAAELASGWVEEYRRFSATLAVTEASQRRLFFARQLSSARDDLVRAEEEMKQTEQRTGVLEMDGQAHAMIASAAVLRAQLAAKEVEIRAMRQFAADQNPDLKRAQQELAGMQRQLTAMDVASDRQTGDLVAPKGKMTQVGLDYVRALREVKYRETIQELMARQYEIACVDEARQGTQLQIVDPAGVPDRPSSLYRIWILIAAVLFAPPVALLIAFAFEILDLLRLRRRRAGSWSRALEEAWAGGAR